LLDSLDALLRQEGFDLMTSQPNSYQGK
jgi:hypothetical protein